MDISEIVDSISSLNLSNTTIPDDLLEIKIRNRNVHIVRSYRQETWALFNRTIQTSPIACMDCEFYNGEVHLIQISFGDPSDIYIIFPHLDHEIVPHLKKSLGMLYSKTCFWGCNLDLCNLYIDLDLQIRNPYDVQRSVPRKEPKNLEKWVKYHKLYETSTYGSSKGSFQEGFSQAVLSGVNYWSDITYEKIEYAALDCVYIELAVDKYRYTLVPIDAKKLYKNIVSSSLNHNLAYIPKNFDSSDIRACSNMISFTKTAVMVSTKFPSKFQHWKKFNAASLENVKKYALSLVLDYPIFDSVFKDLDKI